VPKYSNNPSQINANMQIYAIKNFLAPESDFMEKNQHRTDRT
jgi:hypothetical protein